MPRDRRFLPRRVAVEAQERRGRELPEQAQLPSVSAVPSGATVSGKPASSKATTSICPSTTITRRSARLAGPALSRLNKVRPFVEQGRVGGVQIFGLASPRIRPLKPMQRPRGVADREHQPAAEAVVGLLALFLRLNEKTCFYEFVITEVLERGFELAAAVRGEAEANFRIVASPTPRCFR